jgi:formyl-CoA transferase
MATFATDADVMEALAAARVPHGPALSPAQAASHPHFIERGVVRTVHDPLAGDMQVPGFPFKATGLVPDPDLVAPGLGEHNVEVLTAALGYDPTTVDDLTERGVLYSKPY